MAIDNGIKKDVKMIRQGEHVQIEQGVRYAILSCSKHHLSSLVAAADNMLLSGWSISSGITSEDGKLFQALNKSPSDNIKLNSKKGV